MTEEAQTDHDLILMLKNKIEHLEEEVKETENNLNESLSEHHETAEQLAFHEKLEAQASLLRSVFYGVIFLVMMMGILVIVGWVTTQSTIEREMAFFERIILVFIGIVGGAVWPSSRAPGSTSTWTRASAAPAPRRRRPW